MSDSTSPPVKLLAFSGSLRAESHNQRLVIAAANLARAAGAEVDVVSLRDFDLPIFSEDAENASELPGGCLEFKAALKSHQGFIIASPEFNSSLTAALKNAIDWATLPAPGEAPLECFSGKIVGLCAASPGALGGVRGLDHVREILSNIMCTVVPPGVAVGGIHEAFDDNGELKPGRPADMLKQMAEAVVKAARAMHG